MFRFSIRDLFWATTVVALGIGWWLQSRHSQFLETERKEAVDYAWRAREVLDRSMKQCLNLESQKARGWQGLFINDDVDYRILQEPVTSTSR